MKLLKILLIVLFLAIATGICGFFYLQYRLTPTYSGEVIIPGLEDRVEVYFTEYGIPHIYGGSANDVYKAFGYIHAQDRLWQMDLLRHVGSGTLSELFGKDMVQTDIFLRTMGLNSYSEASANSFQERNHPSNELAQAYIDGINTYIKNNPKPLEHTLLGLDVQPFEIKNIFQTLTYMSFSFSNAHITDPVLTELSQKLDSGYLQDLQIYHYPNESTLKTFDQSYASYAKQITSLLHTIQVPEFIGSNSWVLSEELTQNGKVILTNDPHIAFSQPSVWYEAHLSYPENAYYGYHVAGVPFPLLMHNEAIATGLTMFENDDMDFYVEEIHPEDSNTYRHKNAWKQFQSKTESIKVNGADPVDITIRSNVHGPVVSDILREESLDDIVTMHWVLTNHDNFMIESLYGLAFGKTIRDVETATALIHGPGLNIMYGDSSGNIAWWATGKLLKRRDEFASKTFYDGSTGLDDPDSTYAFSKNPRAINPPWGYVHSANNQPDTVNGVIYSGYYLPDDRAERITELLSNNDQRFDADYMKEMLLDTRSITLREIKGILLHAIKDTERSTLLRALISWDASFDPEDFRPLVFQYWMYEILEHTKKDEIGDELWPTYQKTHTYKVSAEHLIKNKESKWWDNVNTDEVETRAEIISKSFEAALLRLEKQFGKDHNSWKWGDVHRLTHKHALGDILSFLNVGPFSVAGTNEVLNNMGFVYSDEPVQTILFGPSTRRIVDFSDVAGNSWSILPTGQSGNYFSAYFDDQAQMYIDGKFRKMILSEEEIKKTVNKLVLKPKN